MSDARMPRSRPPPPGGRFRCAVCARWVHAGPSGLCPRCGYAPPMPLLPADLGAPDESDEPSPRWWALVVVFSLAVGVLAALAALR
jgi:hypothetical protein